MCVVEQRGAKYANISGDSAIPGPIILSRSWLMNIPSSHTQKMSQIDSYSHTLNDFLRIFLDFKFQNP